MNTFFIIFFTFAVVIVYMSVKSVPQGIENGHGKIKVDDSIGLYTKKITP